MTEWADIRKSLESFPQYLNEAFQPLTAEFQTPLRTPFGDALFYRSFDIAAMWTIYHMTHIILLRSHPSMPAAAMLAQGIAAAQTAPHANTIGRIAAAIVPDPIPDPLNPSLGAAMTESTMPLFFAGVQYRDFEQRKWLVTRIRSIEERTGWASTGLIANGCEKAWVKAFEAGRGPEWVPMMKDLKAEDERRRWLDGYKYEKDGRGGGQPHLVPFGRGVVGATEGLEETDRRLVKTSKNARLHWAVGIIGVEEDIQRMSIE
jgi:hypothetical protein